MANGHFHLPMGIEIPALADTSGWFSFLVFDAFGKRGVDHRKMLEFNSQKEGVAVHNS